LREGCNDPIIQELHDLDLLRRFWQNFVAGHLSPVACCAEVWKESSNGNSSNKTV
jgi:hypothetical protein